MEYKIVAYHVTYSLSDFVLAVNVRIKEGWKPQGGVCILEDNKGKLYAYQAIVRERS